MKHSWRIGRVAGIDIFIDSSWFVIFVLFTWAVSTSFFPQRFPDKVAVFHWILGTLTSLLVFASVLVHELSHSLVAKKQGETVKSITLFIFGGVAQITAEPKEPIHEFTMAFAGPLASFAVAGVSFIASFLLAGFSEPMAAVALYLSMINIGLGIFNLLPGFPMDGGRVLRSIVWKITGDLKKATRIASISGQVFAFFFIMLGILQVLRGAISGLWLVFIGWFLHSAAVRGYRQVVTESLLEGVKARDLMNREYTTIPRWLPIQALLDEYILKKKERVFLVEDNDQVLGIVCLEDVKTAPRDRWEQMTVADVMTPKDELESVSPDTDGSEILKSLAAHDINQVPVIEEGRVTGIICRTELLRYIQLKRELGV